MLPPARGATAVLPSHPPLVADECVLRAPCGRGRYDERNPFVLCNAELIPIYRGSVSIARCTLCKAAYLPAHVGKKCQTCGLGEVGGEAAGLDETATLSRSHD